MPANPGTGGAAVLGLFEPAVREFFHTNFRAPTGVQNASWPVIAAGKHALITAPTGSGKTLTAFLWAINQFVKGCLLYTSPSPRDQRGSRMPSSA